MTLVELSKSWKIEMASALVEGQNFGCKGVQTRISTKVRSCTKNLQCLLSLNEDEGPED